MQRRSTAGFTFVELMVVVTIISVLAAIAIPMFLRFVRNSKLSESEIMMKKMAEGARIYFSSEQRYSEPGGSEPWHPEGAGSSAAGLPVPWPQYVFPGAGLAPINTSEPECTGGVPGVAGAPSGGQKHIPCAGVPAPTGTIHLAVQNKLRINFTDPLYFKYYYQSSGSGQDALATLNATADFVIGGPAHNARVLLSVGDSQEVNVGLMSVTHEFQ